MSTLPQFQRVLERERPETIELAESLSLAALIDPPLIRTMRLRLHPRFHAAVEADFWFSRFVESRASDGVVLDSEMANALRLRLKETGRLDSAWDVVREVHRNTSPAVRIEEEVGFLAAKGDPESLATVRSYLRNALAALVAGDRQGLGMWALRALPRMPAAIRETEEARMLQAAAKARLTGELEEIENKPEWRWLLPSVVLKATTIGVRLFEDALEIGPPAEGARPLEIPLTRPLIVRVESGGNAENVKFEVGESRRIPVARGPVRIQTADGASHEIERADEVDYEPILRQHTEFFDAHGLMNMLLDIVSESHGARVVVTGPPGIGKTALCVQLARWFAARGQSAVLAQHFSSRSSRLWRDPDLAARSLWLQIESATVDRNHPGAPRHPFSLEEGSRDGRNVFDRLKSCLKDYSGNAKLMVVVDALDEVEPGDAKDKLLDALSVPLSPDVAVVLSASRTTTLQTLELMAAETLDLRRIAESRGSDAVPRAILKDFLTGVALEEFVELAGGNPFQAWVLGHLQGKYPGLRPGVNIDPSSAMELRGLQEAVWSAVGPGSTEGRAIAVVCAMREPAPLAWLVTMFGEGMEALAERSIGLLATDDRRVWPRHESVYDVFRNRVWDEAFQPHAWILDRLIPWPLPPDTDPELVEYAVRYWAYHADHSGRPTIPPDLGFVEAMLRHLGAVETLAILESTEFCSEPARTQLRGLVRYNAPLLNREPARIHDLMYRRLVEMRYPLGDLLDTAYFSEGAPALRPREPSSTKPYVDRGVDQGADLHRGPVHGCLACSPTEFLSWGQDGLVILWNRATGSGVRVADLRTPIDHGIRRTGDTDLPAADRIVLGCRDGSLLTYVLSTRESVALGGCHNGAIRGLLPTDDGLVTWGADRTIRSWRETPSGSFEPLHVMTGHDDEVLSCTFALRRRWLISGAADHTIRIWDLRNSRVEAVLHGHRGPVTRVRIMDDRYIISASEDATLKLWELTTGSLVRTFNGHDLAVGDCSVVRGELFLSASLDRTAKLWSIADAEPKATFTGHHGAVYRCRFVGSAHVMTCSADGTLKLWRDDGQIVRTFYGHRGAVRQFRDVDSETIVSCSDDGTLRAWVPK